MFNCAPGIWLPISVEAALMVSTVQYDFRGHLVLLEAEAEKFHSEATLAEAETEKARAEAALARAEREKARADAMAQQMLEAQAEINRLKTLLADRGT
jgi:uncharacterized protein (DUF3084 family)